MKSPGCLAQGDEGPTALLNAFSLHWIVESIQAISLGLGNKWVSRDLSQIVRTSRHR